MIQDLLLFIAPSEIDSEIMKVAEYYFFIFVPFLLIGLWIILRIFFRSWQIYINRKRTERLLKKNDSDLRSTRIQVALKAFKWTSWARNNYEKFRLAWEESRPEGEESAILPIHLREFLTPEIVLDGVRNRRLAEALPGIFVALGIFGTFLGLVLGLRGLELGNLDRLESGVGQLISGLSIAFLTSLAGIAMSILFSLFYRFFINRLERALLVLDQVFSRIYPYESHERYARRYFDLQADIKHGLQTLATDVATQISGTMEAKLGKAFEEHFIPAVKDLQGMIQKHIEQGQKQQVEFREGFKDQINDLGSIIQDHFERSQDRQSEAMGEVLKKYSEELTQTFQDQFQTMGELLEKTGEAQKEISQQLGDFSEQLQHQLSSQAELIDRTNRAGEVLSQSLESLESIAEKLKSSADDITSAAEMLEKSATAAKDGQEMLRETMELQVQSMSSTREELEKTWGIITNDAQEMMDKTSDTVKELTTGVSENMVKALELFDGTVGEVIERFSGTLYDTKETISDIPSLVSSVNDSIKEIRESLHDQTAVLGEIRETSKSAVADNVEMASEAAKRLSESTEQISDTSVTLSKIFNSFSQMIEDPNGILYQTLQKGSDHAESDKAKLKNSLEELTPAFEKLTTQLEQIALSSNGGDVKDLQKHQAEALQYLASIQSKIERLPKEMTNGLEFLEQMSTNISQMNELLENIRQSFLKIEQSKEPKSGGLFGFGGRR